MALLLVCCTTCGAVAQKGSILMLRSLRDSTKKVRHEVLSPLDFGLNEARSDTARYRVLLRTHQEAVRRGADISYEGVGRLSIELPPDAVSIPLPHRCDFAGTRLHVSNDAKNMTLFVMSNAAQDVEVDASLLDGGDFTSVEQLRQGWKLLVLSDKEPWVAERIGYGYAAMRSDVLLLHDGHALNSAAMPYAAPPSRPTTRVVSVDDDDKWVRDLVIDRAEGAAFKTNCFSFSGVNGLRLEQITINTPYDPKKYADAAVHFGTCTNIEVNDMVINGTYSQQHEYGYGISMNNTWNVVFNRLKATGAWGVFGTNNISNTTLNHCDVNRFDIHCYGRNAYFRGCTFRGQHVQYGSGFGEIVYDSCTFEQCHPVFIRPEYNAYTPMDVVLRHCIIYATPQKDCVLKVGRLDTPPNSRPELTQKCWPNVVMEDVTVVLSRITQRFYLYKVDGRVRKQPPVGYLNHIRIKDLHVRYTSRTRKPDFYLCNKSVRAASAVECELSGLDMVRSKLGYNIEPIAE